MVVTIASLRVIIIIQKEQSLYGLASQPTHRLFNRTLLLHDDEHCLALRIKC